MTHQDCLELLPWYVNGTVEEHERHQIAAHLQSCADCTQEVETLTLLQADWVDLGDQGPAPSPDLLASAHQHIARYEQEQSPTRETAPSRVTNARTTWANACVSWWTPIPGFARYALAAQFVLIIALGVLVLPLPQEQADEQTLSRPSTPTRMLESESTPSQSFMLKRKLNVQMIANSAPDLAVRPVSLTTTNPTLQIRIGFQEGVSEVAMRQLIRGIKGTIVDGPSVLGLYTIAVRFPADQSDTVEALLTSLRANHHLIQVVEQKM